MELYNDFEKRPNFTFEELKLALCAYSNPEEFFPERGKSPRHGKKLCLQCSIQSRCLEIALANEEPFGVWGGLDPRERRKLRRKNDAS